MHSNPRPAHLLAHLLELADKGPALRAALAEEVAELLTDWPADCPLEMRSTCEALLASAAREVDNDTRTRLRVRLYADMALAARVLPRETLDAPLIETARGGGEIASRLAESLGLTQALAEEILADTSGRALACACKTLGVGRATFSTLALLAASQSDRADRHACLDAYDATSAGEAARQLRQWRSGESARAA